MSTVLSSEVFLERSTETGLSLAPAAIGRVNGCRNPSHDVCDSGCHHLSHVSVSQDVEMGMRELISDSWMVLDPSPIVLRIPFMAWLEMVLLGVCVVDVSLQS